MTRSDVDEKALKSAAFCAVKGNVSCELEGEAVILQMSTGTYFGLNEVGRTVWDLIQQRHSYEEIASKVHDEYEVDRAKLDLDLHTLLKDMLSAGLVEMIDTGRA